MNEFNAELEKFIEETVQKALVEHTAKTIEDTVKNVLGKYCAETNNQIELLTTAVNTLMSILINTRFPNTEELKAIMDKALEDKVAEIRNKNLGEKVEVQDSESAKPDS